MVGFTRTGETSSAGFPSRQWVKPGPHIPGKTPAAGATTCSCRDPANWGHPVNPAMAPLFLSTAS